VFDTVKPYYPVGYRHARSAYMFAAGLGYSNPKDDEGWHYNDYKKLSDSLPYSCIKI